MKAALLSQRSVPCAAIEGVVDACIIAVATVRVAALIESDAQPAAELQLLHILAVDGAEGREGGGEDVDIMGVVAVGGRCRGLGLPAKGAAGAADRAL